MLGRFLRRRDPRGAVDPSVVAAAEIQATLDELWQSLKDGEVERARQRQLAEQARDRAAELLERNHFGESIQKAMERRR